MSKGLLTSIGRVRRPDNECSARVSLLSTSAKEYMAAVIVFLRNQSWVKEVNQIG